MYNQGLENNSRDQNRLVVVLTGFFLLKTVIGTSIPPLPKISSTVTVAFSLILLFALTSHNVRINSCHLCVGLIYLATQIPIALVLPTWTQALSMGKTILFLWLGYLTFFVFTSSFSLKESDICKIFRSYVVLITIFCGLNVYLNGLEMVHFLTGRVVSNKISFASIFSNRNSFGFYLYFAFAQALHLYRSSKRKKYLAALFLISTNLAFTLSRASILSTLAFSVIFNFIRSKRNRFLHLFIGLFGFGVAVLIMNTIPIFENLWNSIVRGGSSGRIDLWIYGTNLISKRPLLGYGYGSSSGLLEIGEFSLKSFHNAYINILVDGGIVFLMMYIGIIVYLILIGLKILKKDRLAGTTFVSLTLSYCIYSLFESNILFSASPSASVATVTLSALPILYCGEIATCKDNFIFAKYNRR